jgi:hypothetical protein
MPTLKRQRKSCTPQPLAGDPPSRDWDRARLAEYAKQQYQQIVAGEKTAASHYWRLGDALIIARRKSQHGEWSAYLTSLGIDKTRSSRACAIRRRFPSVDELIDKTVQEACAAARRTAPPKSQQEDEPDTKVSLSLHTTLAQTELQAAQAIEKITRLPVAAVRELLVAVRSAIDQLRSVERQLREVLINDDFTEAGPSVELSGAISERSVEDLDS